MEEEWIGKERERRQKRNKKNATRKKRRLERYMMEATENYKRAIAAEGWLALMHLAWVVTASIAVAVVVALLRSPRWH